MTTTSSPHPTELLLHRILSFGPALSPVDHDQWLERDRTTYAALLLQPIAARESMAIITRLLAITNAVSAANKQHEDRLIAAALPALPVQIVLAGFKELVARRVNNQRVSNAIRSYLFGSPELERLAVTYRAPLARLVTHALGRRTTASCLRAFEAEPRESAFLEKNVYRFARDRRVAREVFLHLFGRLKSPVLPLLRAYREARGNIERGRGLPFKTLQGIAGTFHPKTRRRTLHALAPTEKVKREINQALDAIDDSPIALIRRAYETPKDAAHLRARARDALAELAEHLEPWETDVAIVLDASRSMKGVGHRAYNSMAIAVAIAELCRLRARRAELIVAGGRGDAKDLFSIEPEGVTPLAPSIVEAVSRGAGAVVVITDGFENVEPGDAASIAAVFEKMKLATPIVQVTPVFTEREQIEGRRLSASWPLVQEDGLAEKGQHAFAALWLRLRVLTAPSEAIALIRARAKE